MPLRIAPESAQSLAAFRIALAIILLVSPEARDASRWAELAPELRVAPEGLGWFAAHAPFDPMVVRVAQGIFAASALATIVGVYTRPALVALTLTGLYLFAIPQLGGTVTHDMHLLWFSAILAASPCGDALAFDRRKLPPAPRSVAYAWPLVFLRLLLGVIYFFPGFWKLATSGLAWATSDNLRNQMYWKWLQTDWVPGVRIDHAPALLHAAGIGVIVFELTFVFLAAWRRTRLVALACGLAFHFFADALLRIPFFSLWGCYVVLVDWDALARRLRRRATPPPETSHPLVRAIAPAIVVGALLVVGATFQGARGATNAWPFACYPTFQWLVGTEMPDLQIEAIDAQGGAKEIVHARDAYGTRPQRTWGVLWSLAGVTGSVDLPRLGAYVDEVARAAPVGTERLRAYRAYYSVVPEDRGRPPLRRDLLLDVPINQAK